MRYHIIASSAYYDKKHLFVLEGEKTRILNISFWQTLNVQGI
jgi:hypothetical protein